VIDDPYVEEPTARIKALSTSFAKVERVTLLGPNPQVVTFRQTAEALLVTLPLAPPSQGMPYTLRIEGSGVFA
jgi:hypothetical protein